MNWTAIVLAIFSLIILASPASADRPNILFIFAADPLEMDNVAESNPEKVTELAAELRRLQGETGDELDLSSAFPGLGFGSGSSDSLR